MNLSELEKERELNKRLARRIRNQRASLRAQDVLINQQREYHNMKPVIHRRTLQLAVDHCREAKAARHAMAVVFFYFAALQSTERGEP